VANNHAPDYGDLGLEGTVAAIASAGMVVVGTASQPRVTLGSGVTLTAWTEWTNGVTTGVATADPGPPSGPGLHLAFPHWGYEFERAPRAEQRMRLPRGYAAVIGHHSHIPQDPEVVDGRLVAWSLGNFSTAIPIPVMGEGAVLKLGLADVAGGPTIVRARYVPLRLDRSPEACALARG
jgi:hypothetical protein